MWLRTMLLGGTVGPKEHVPFLPLEGMSFCKVPGTEHPLFSWFDFISLQWQKSFQVITRQVLALTSRPESYRDWNIVFVTPSRPGQCRALAVTSCGLDGFIARWVPCMIRNEQGMSNQGIFDTPPQQNAALACAHALLRGSAAKVRVVFEVAKIPPPLCFIFEFAFSPSLPVTWLLGKPPPFSQSGQSILNELGCKAFFTHLSNHRVLEDPATLTCTQRCHCRAARTITFSYTFRARPWHQMECRPFFCCADCRLRGCEDLASMLLVDIACVCATHPMATC